jgi:hypothetical protein
MRFAEDTIKERDWRDADRDSVTTLYVPRAEGTPQLPKMPQPPPADRAAHPTPTAKTVRTFELHAFDERVTVPTIDQKAAARRSKPPARVDATYVVRRMPAPTTMVTFAAACLVFGIAVGAIVAFRSSSADKPPAEPIAPVVTAPAPTPTFAPIVTPAPAPAPAPRTPHVTVRIESRPAGATAMIVDDGKPSVLGTTPIDTEVDASRSYELVVTLEGREPRIERLDPAQRNHVVVELAPAAAR